MSSVSSKFEHSSVEVKQAVEYTIWDSRMKYGLKTGIWTLPAWRKQFQQDDSEYLGEFFKN